MNSELFRWNSFRIKKMLPESYDNFLFRFFSRCTTAILSPLTSHKRLATENTKILLAIMFPRTEVFEAIPFDASSDNKEPLIAGGDAEEEDHRLEEGVFSRFKFSSLLLGLLVGYFIRFSILGAIFLGIAIFGEDAFTKPETAIDGFRLFWSFFASAITIGILGFLRNLVTFAYSAVGGRSKDVLDVIVFNMELRFFVGTAVGFCLGWTMTDILLDMRTHMVYSLVTILVVALFWCKIMTMCFATEKKTSSSHRSSAQRTMTVV
jgi:hypothetical protein